MLSDEVAERGALEYDASFDFLALRSVDQRIEVFPLDAGVGVKRFSEAVHDRTLALDVCVLLGAQRHYLEVLVALQL